MTSDEIKVSKEQALEYHKKNGKPGKIEINPTKPLLTQYDMSLAYSPGVAHPCNEISKNPDLVYEYTSKGNMVAVVSNGTAVLGLGNLGAAASKPVMEGKAVLFKKFADIDSIDIEVSTEDPDEFINAIKYLGSSWGGINLEDIKSPECFYIEKKLQELLDIPVFHDDQHGTAIIAAAGLMNALYVTDKKIDQIKLVSNGSGAAGIACAELLLTLGLNPENLIMCDREGVIYKGRKTSMNPYKEKFAIDTELRTLQEAMKGADVFLGLSVKGAVSKEMVGSMNERPVIFAMANPDPEITLEEVKKVRSDAIFATGRSDYNNQVNNVMCFPYIFRGALDVRAKRINEEMKLAAAKAIADLARQPVPKEVEKAYSGKKLKFGPDYIIPVPFDPRLIEKIPVAVAEAAIKSGASQMTDFDLVKYKIALSSRLDISTNYMNLIFEQVKKSKQRIIFAEGEEEEVISAALNIRDNGYATPILVGRIKKIEPILTKLGDNLTLDGIEVTNAAVCDELDEFIDFVYRKLQRKGYLYRDCARLVKSDRNIFASCILAHGRADGLVTGSIRGYFSCLSDIRKIISTKENHIVFGYSILLTKDKDIIISDCSVNESPTSDELADIASQTAEIAKKIGYNPKIAMLSYSSFGNPAKEKSLLIRDAVNILHTKDPNLEVDGEMSPDIALNKFLMNLYPFRKLTSPANILIMPDLNSAVISTKLFQELSDGKIIGPILTGLSKPVQIAQVGASAEQIIKLATFAAAEAIQEKMI
ncbi:MAG: NADP-dependent malic enzyme [Rickettsiaceae bacterium]|nr:NADP-dependent malic enzyme [Rickettsiaceae bacterium]